MKLYSTQDSSHIVSFHDALFQGQAKDRGLYMPVQLPSVSRDELLSWSSYSYKELALAVAGKYLLDEIPQSGLEEIINNAYHFAPELYTLDEHTQILELFHGPTLSFKDFGAQFMARSMSYFVQHEHREITILVATSGDTGSAVAHAYHNVPGVRIVLLYPSGKVSPLQEKQFTTLGDNIQALEIDGTFDDCQALVKKAFADKDLRDKMTLSSANSINIGRLIPQSFYYFWSVLQVYAQRKSDVVVCVPSGNFGNLTAGLFGWEMGLPVKQYIAAVNNNSVIPEYFETHEYSPRPSVATLSNAMDVGNPSNWERIRALYKDDYDTITNKLWTTTVDDETTLATMRETKDQFDYVIDPHTAVGVQALQRYRKTIAGNTETPSIVLSTAHPGKFQEIVNRALDTAYQLPDALEKLKVLTKLSEKMGKDFEDFKEYLWEM